MVESLVVKMMFLLALLFVATATAEEIDSHLVGGSNGWIGDYPWNGALMYNNGFTCGCTLISNRYVLTAAHCVDGRETP